MTGQRKRLAIIGGGSSGLITLKLALDELPDWEIVCFEKSDCITGCWGRPYPGFVSTSTKYTTQFACFPQYDGMVKPDGGASRDEFFREDEYGRYLEQFADHFHLRQHIQLNANVELLKRTAEGDGWELSCSHAGGSSPARTTQELFDAVVICTGLAARPKRVESKLPMLSVAELNSPAGLNHVRGKRVVVIGGGESAVDYAVRLSRPELGNRVFLSLYTGIRISPRYHPIRGVPSDFLRNRLMLSIHEDMRNWIGQRFVEARIKYQERFERWFPSRVVQRLETASATASSSADTVDAESRVAQLRKHWAYLLTKRAKDDLFNMFHNKSDGFLEAVAREEIRIVGQPLDPNYVKCSDFETNAAIDVEADLLVPAIGFQSTLGTLSESKVSVRDFYLGCCHVEHPDLFLVGFARPIIGNIPTVSEVQAKFICSLISGRVARDPQIHKLHQAEAENQQLRFAKLNLDAIYPVEMFPYCDKLAKRMGAYPTVSKLGSVASWCREQLTPATTMHYVADDTTARSSLRKTPIYMPPLLIALLLILKPIDWSYRIAKRLRTRSRS